MQRKYRMILRSLLIAGFCLISPTWGAMTRDDFEKYIEPICLPKPNADGQPLLINGQENSLSQTIENFIGLAEKFEAANPNYGLQNELFYFLRRYSYDNVEFNRLGDIIRWEPKEAKMDEINNFWEPEESIRNRELAFEDPFTDPEKCSLFSMISHSIIRMPRASDVQRSYTNDSRDNLEFNLNNQYPMELGVVAVQGTQLAVELGRVLRGIYVGLQSNRRVDLSGINRINKTLLEGHGTEIDRLYAVTLAEVIALSNWRPEVGQREKLAGDGYWVSTPINNGGNSRNTSEICPMIYRLKANETAAFSYSSMRGAADGFILGKIIDTIASTKKVKLSQILRQYYNGGGIFESDNELGNVWASFCNRDPIINSIEDTLKEQTYLYQLLAALSYKYLPETFTFDYYLTQKSSIFGIYDSAIREVCTKQYTLDKPENFPRETPLDVIAVIDTSQGEEYTKKQQLILGYFAKEMDLRYSGSRMTILTDQRVPSAAASAAGTVLLRTIVEESFSSPCAACAVTQISWEDSPPSAPEDEVIVGINQYLQARKTNQTEKNGIIGKVVIYFNLKEDQKNARPTQLQNRVEKALIDFRHNHLEVSIYPLGRSANAVKKFARNEGTFVLSAIEEPEPVVARKLFRRVTTAPAILQYIDCKDRRNEKNAIFEYYVSPSTVQHWSMPAKYFYKSTNMKFTFESKYGPIRVCYNRATPSPELTKIACEDIPNGQKKDFVTTNPCEYLDDFSCPPLFFSVIGVNATSTERQGTCVDNTESICRTIDQTYFKVTHEGIRCSGSASIMANAALLLLGVILLNFLSKKY